MFDFFIPSQCLWLKGSGFRKRAVHHSLFTRRLILGYRRSTKIHNSIGTPPCTFKQSGVSVHDYYRSYMIIGYVWSGSPFFDSVALVESQLSSFASSFFPNPVSIPVLASTQSCQSFVPATYLLTYLSLCVQ